MSTHEHTRQPAQHSIRRSHAKAHIYASWARRRQGTAFTTAKNPTSHPTTKQAQHSNECQIFHRSPYRALAECGGRRTQGASPAGLRDLSARDDHSHSAGGSGGSHAQPLRPSGASSNELQVVSGVARPRSTDSPPRGTYTGARCCAATLGAAWRTGHIRHSERTSAPRLRQSPQPCSSAAEQWRTSGGGRAQLLKPCHQQLADARPSEPAGRAALPRPTCCGGAVYAQGPAG